MIDQFKKFSRVMNLRNKRLVDLVFNHWIEFHRNHVCKITLELWSITYGITKFILWDQYTKLAEASEFQSNKRNTLEIRSIQIYILGTLCHELCKKHLKG